MHHLKAMIQLSRERNQKTMKNKYSIFIVPREKELDIKAPFALTSRLVRFIRCLQWTSTKDPWQEFLLSRRHFQRDQTAKQKLKVILFGNTRGKTWP